MATQDELKRALKRAAEAGDIESANEIALHLEMGQERAIQAQKDEIWEAEPWYNKMLIGAGQGVEELRQGATELLGGEVSEQEKADLAEVRAIDDPLKTGGKLLGDIATYAVPGAAAGRVLRSALPGALAALAGDVAATAAIDYTRAPDEGRTRGETAAMGATGALAGAGVTHALSKAMRGINRTRLADEMLERGVPLTPGQAASGRMTPWLEKRAGDLPGVAGTVARRQQAAQEAWNLDLLNKVNPLRRTDEAVPIMKPGLDGMVELQSSFKVAYDDVWQSVNPNTVDFKKISDTWRPLARRLTKDVPADLQAEARRILDSAQELVIQFGKTGDTRFLERADDVLREASGKMDASDWLDAARDGLKAALPADAGSALRQVDSDYANYIVLQRASTYQNALDNDGIFTPSDLTRAVKAKGSEHKLAGKAARMQGEASKAAKTIDKFTPREDSFGQKLTVPAVGVAAMVDPVTTGSALLGGNIAFSEFGRRTMLGEYPVQAAGRFIDRWGGRAGATGARLGAAYENTLTPYVLSPHQRRLRELRMQAEAVRRNLLR